MDIITKHVRIYSMEDIIDVRISSGPEFNRTLRETGRHSNALGSLLMRRPIKSWNVHCMDNYAFEYFT